MTVLGRIDNRWKVLDKVSVKKLQNSLVCFELRKVLSDQNLSVRM